MRKTIKIGNKSVDLLCNAVTPILYKNAFGQDMLAALLKQASLERDDPRLPDEQTQGMSIEERREYLAKVQDYYGRMIDLLRGMEDTIGKLAFVMAYQARCEDNGDKPRMTGVTEEMYLDFLGDYENEEIAGAMQDILAVYRGSSAKTVTAKNGADRSIESTAQPSTL